MSAWTISRMPMKVSSTGRSWNRTDECLCLIALKGRLLLSAIIHVLLNPFVWL
jgi:anti-sigma factor ChrR (cupin superfamily)